MLKEYFQNIRTVLRGSMRMPSYREPIIYIFRSSSPFTKGGMYQGTALNERYLILPILRVAYLSKELILPNCVPKYDPVKQFKKYFF